MSSRTRRANNHKLIIKRIRSKYGYPICTTKNDIYTIDKYLGDEETEDGYTINLYSVVDNDLLTIKKKIGNGGTLSSIGQMYAHMYSWIKNSSNVIFARICSDDNLKPVAFIVVEDEMNNAPNNVPKGGALCDMNRKYLMGKQIGAKEQMEQSEDSLYIDFNDNNIIIKKITGGGSPHSHSNNPNDIGKVYIDIYTEIKLSMKAANINVGPRILYSKICNDKNLKPVGYLVMERIHGRYLNENEVTIEKLAIRNLIDKLYDAGINHGDLHNRNIMKGNTLSDPTERIWIIDYGDAEFNKKVMSKDKRRYVISYIPEEQKNPILKIIYI